MNAQIVYYRDTGETYSIGGTWLGHFATVDEVGNFFLDTVIVVR